MRGCHTHLLTLPPLPSKWASTGIRALSASRYSNTMCTPTHAGRPPLEGLRPMLQQRHQLVQQNKHCVSNTMCTPTHAGRPPLEGLRPMPQQRHNLVQQNRHCVSNTMCTPTHAGRPPLEGLLPMLQQRHQLVQQNQQCGFIWEGI